MRTPITCANRQFSQAKSDAQLADGDVKTCEESIRVCVHMEYAEELCPDVRVSRPRCVICWRPSPKKLWRIVLVLRELAFGRCRRTDTQVNRALGHAMYPVGLRRELYSVFQNAYQFVTHFEGCVGRVSASVRREFRIAWALLPFAKGELSRPWDASVHVADASLSEMGVATSVG